MSTSTEKYKRILSESDKKVLIKSSRKFTASEFAERFETYPRLIRSFCRSRNLKLKESDYKYKFTEKQIKKMKEVATLHYKNEIAKIIGAPVNSVSTYCRKHNIMCKGSKPYRARNPKVDNTKKGMFNHKKYTGENALIGKQ